MKRAPLSLREKEAPNTQSQIEKELIRYPRMSDMPYISFSSFCEYKARMIFMNKIINIAFFSRILFLPMYLTSMRRNICRQHARGLSLRVLGNA
ncbi:hypothetical protein [Legionella hackeliae]|uniref:hypothetical protein n=1 Tax=Legionella hackeliae TaxID=449 RepID=UPI000A9ED563|nr:hypothetical protein [Legionella hackeliae]